MGTQIGRRNAGCLATFVAPIQIIANTFVAGFRTYVHAIWPLTGDRHVEPVAVVPRYPLLLDEMATRSSGHACHGMPGRFDSLATVAATSKVAIGKDFSLLWAARNEVMASPR